MDWEMRTVSDTTGDEVEGCLHRGRFGRGAILANRPPRLRVTWSGVGWGVAGASSVSLGVIYTAKAVSGKPGNCAQTQEIQTKAKKFDHAILGLLLFSSQILFPILFNLSIAFTIPATLITPVPGS